MFKITKEGDLILDPFSGSGSMGEACIKNKRQCIVTGKQIGRAHV